MRQTKQQLQAEIDRLRARLAAFGITEEMEPEQTMLVTTTHTFGLNYTTPLQPMPAPIWSWPSMPCEVCGKPATTMNAIPGGYAGWYCDEHKPFSGPIYTDRRATDGKPIY